MSKNWMFVCAASLAAYAGGCQPAASSEPRLQLTFSGEEVSPGLSVQGGAGGSYSLGGTTVNLKLNLIATPQATADGFRLIASSVFLKAEGPDRGKILQGVEIGSASAEGTEEISLAVDPLGPVAQNAKAACVAPNGGMVQQRDVAMLVPVVWRVTSGAFAFARLAAGGLTPQEAMLSDAAYYGDTASEDAETLVTLKVSCKGAQVAAQPAPRAVGEQKIPVAKVQPAVARVPEKPKAVVSEPVAASVQPAAVRETVSNASPFRCEGGIVRETVAGAGHEVCLCPGNTARSQIAERAYTCEKRLARSR